LTDAEIEKMRKEAETNAESDKTEREKVDKVNAADSLIFQTDKQLKEYGDKLSEGNKTAIESALEELKAAHKSQDIAAVDAAMNKLNTAWQNASQEMYQAAGGADAGAADGNTQTGGPESSNAGADDSVSDVEYEEVDDKDKK
jgi:molecular chaperone DnaK